MSTSFSVAIHKPEESGGILDLLSMSSRAMRYLKDDLVDTDGTWSSDGLERLLIWWPELIYSLEDFLYLLVCYCDYLLCISVFCFCNFLFIWISNFYLFLKFKVLLPKFQKVQFQLQMKRTTRFKKWVSF